MSVKTFIINGNNFDCDLEDLVLVELIENFLRKNKIKPKKIAVALNNNLVKESKWKKTKICENDRIEIVVPFCGG
jgi:thiamine biosynthesis protein ThiS